MERKNLVPLLIGSVLTLAAAFGVITYRSVSAQESTPTPDTQPAQPGPGKGLRGGPGGGYTQEDLAAALGIGVDELQTAQETAFAEALEQAVSAGLITQEQADQMAAREAGRFHFGGKGVFAENGIDYNALLADALGISTDQLQTAYQQALSTSLDRAVQEGTLTQEQADLNEGRNALFNSSNFQSSMQSAFEAAVNQAVADGVITQAQADLILQNENGFGLPGRHGFGFPGGPHDFDRFGGPGGSVPPPDSTNPAAPTEQAPATSSSNGL